ncbi:hypothetical protein MMC13_000404 [Lambiella insularis]|nr:hypothetical protein [Lambiella insularis]
MQYKLVSLAALAATASAQTMNLTATLMNNSMLSNLSSYVNAFPAISSTLGMAKNITILAPSNDAFAMLLNSSAGMMMANDTTMIQSLLTYHVLNGTYDSSMITNNATFIPTMLTDMMYSNVTGGQRVEAITEGMNATFFSGLLQNATVTQANINFTGGIIHIIDSVLTIPIPISNTAEAAGLSAAVGALMDTKMTAALDNMMDVTAFIPNNAAFQAIGSALGNLTMDQLSSILEYHVINGTVAYSSSLMNNTMLPTMQGNNVTITMMNGSVFVNSAMVILPDVLVANGVVHVIDAVLNPSATTLMPNASTTAVAFMGATSASAVPFTSGVPTPTSTLGGGAAAGMSSASAAAAGSTSSSSAGAWAPMRTGAIGAAALFAAGGAYLNA